MSSEWRPKEYDPQQTLIKLQKLYQAFSSKDPNDINKDQAALALTAMLVEHSEQYLHINHLLKEGRVDQAAYETRQYLQNVEEMLQVLSGDAKKNHYGSGRLPQLIDDHLKHLDKQSKEDSY